MERKIGEIFEYNGEWYQCIKGDSCRCDCYYCDFDRLGDCDIIACASGERRDNKEVYFKKLEKVGEPYEHYEKFYQCYKLPMETEIRLLPNNCYPIGKDNLVEIGIKQSKEDMEEKKQCGDTRFRIIARAKEHLFQATNIAEDKKELEVLDSFLLRCWQMGWLKQYEDAEEKKLNLKPFDLQKAREGKPVCTRDGRKARIICFDRRLFYKNVSYPILALVECSDGEDDVCGYNEKGKVLIEDGAEYKDDLMMIPEKKEGWVNVYYDNDASSHRGCRFIYDTKERAVKEAGSSYITTVKINWEE